ncbi:kinase-like domain-containing protein [Fennellomyces sp. T-0311]|nr:kinase-like domain-containing protein [Fennellomyces sp. T-0311]
MSQVKSDKSSSLPTNVSSPLRFEIISTLTPSKRSLPTVDGDRHDEDGHGSPGVKRTRIDSQPALLRKMLTPTRSAMSETSNLFDQPDIVTQERLKSSYSSDIVFSSPGRKTVETQPVIDDDNSDDQDDLPLASFGWPGLPDDDNDDEEQEEVLTDRHARRSLLSELIQNDEPDVDDDDPERQQSKKDLFQAVLGDEEDEDGWFPPPPSDHAPSQLQHYDDQIHDFFTASHVEDNISTEPMPTSSLRRTYRPSEWQRIKPGYRTTQPRFLTSEYFKEHNPTSCMEEEEEELYEDDDAQHPSQLAAIPYFETKYTILGSLGSGEYAEVFKVEHIETGKQWAIKKTKGPFESYDDRWQQIIEADHMRAVNGSKHCVELTDAWEQEGTLYLQMDLCENGSLQDYINYHNRDIAESDIWAILHEIALGVKAIHDANIIHLDLKPANILIDDSGSIRIGDFGVSVREPVDLRWVKGEGDRRYMAPDLLRDQFHKPADIFSLGLMVLEMAAGIVLPETGEPWEQLRLADFSGCEEALAKTSTKMRSFIEWLMHINSRERPTIDQVLAHPELASRRSSRGVLYDYVQAHKARSPSRGSSNEEQDEGTR